MAEQAEESLLPAEEQHDHEAVRQARHDAEHAEWETDFPHDCRTIAGFVWHDVPLWSLGNYAGSFMFIVSGYHHAAKFIENWSDTTDEQTFFGIEGYAAARLWMIIILWVTFGLNTVVVLVEISLTDYFKVITGLEFLESFVPDISSWFFTYPVYWTWMGIYYGVGIFILLYVMVWFLYFILLTAMKRTCINGAAGDTRDFVNILSEASVNFDDQLRAGEYCDAYPNIRHNNKWAFICFTAAFFTQVNLMGVLSQQHYFLHIKGALGKLDSDEEEELKHQQQEEEARLDALASSNAEEKGDV